MPGSPPLLPQQQQEGTTPTSSSSNSSTTMPIPIRVPNNAHPNYGTTSSSMVVAETPYFSAREDSDFMSRLGSFAQSYSRASVLFMAENIPTSQQHHHHEESMVERSPLLDEEQQGPFESCSNKQHNPLGLERSVSQQTYHSIHLTPSTEGMMAPTTTTAATQTHTRSLYRPDTVASVISQQFKTDDNTPLPKSNFIQSVFNAMNVLIGVGILAFPLAFRYAGWLFGTLIFTFCAIGTNYTAKLLVRCLDAVPGATTYGDIGMAAFGERGRTFIGSVFFVELATMAVAMITLLGDGLQAVYPNMDLVTSRLLCFCLMTPFEFFPLRHLSMASLLGIVSCASLVLVVLVDGFCKHEHPGSLWDPMATEWLPSDLSKIPLSFGLMMAGFAGHAVFPSIYRDMQEPKQYDRMVNITYGITTAVYLTMAAAGYLMFGSQTMQEITQNLAVTPGYNRMLNSVALWLVVVTPIAKFALIMNPLHIAWELWIAARSKVESWLHHGSAYIWKQRLLRFVSRILVTAIAVYIAIVFPGFDRVMSLLGALFSFSISLIFPLLCYQRLYASSISSKKTMMHIVALVIAIGMAFMGTVWSFAPNL